MVQRKKKVRSTKRKTPLIKKHGHMMMALLKASPQMRKDMTKHASKDLIHCVSECCHNVLKGNVPLSSTHLKKLKPKRQLLRKLADKKVSLQTKKRIINQKGGGFLPLLAPLLAPLLSPIVGALTKKFLFSPSEPRQVIKYRH